MAERVGFEPTEPVKVQQFSRLPDSTALAPLRKISFRFQVPGFRLIAFKLGTRNLRLETFETFLTEKILHQFSAFFSQYA